MAHLPHLWFSRQCSAMGRTNHTRTVVAGNLHSGTDLWYVGQRTDHPTISQSNHPANNERPAEHQTQNKSSCHHPSSQNIQRQTVHRELGPTRIHLCKHTTQSSLQECGQSPTRCQQVLNSTCIPNKETRQSYSPD